MCVRLNGQTERAGQTEVRELDCLSIRADKQVLRFQITMENAVLVQVDK